MEKRRSDLLKILLASSALSIVLCLARMLYADSLRYGFLLWNLFLAWIPLLIALQMRLNQRRWIHYSLFLIWLLFLPNAPYIVTDLVHLQMRYSIGLYWFDMFLIFSFAWNGLILGFLSLNRIHSILNHHLNKKISWVIIFVLIFLCAYGVYLGRFERYNSWDVLSNPLTLINDIAYDFIHPFRNKYAIGVSMLMTSFLSIIYMTLLVVKNHRNDIHVLHNNDSIK